MYGCVVMLLVFACSDVSSDVTRAPEQQKLPVLSLTSNAVTHVGKNAPPGRRERAAAEHETSLEHVRNRRQLSTNQDQARTILDLHNSLRRLERAANMNILVSSEHPQGVFSNVLLENVSWFSINFSRVELVTYVIN